MTAMIPDRPVLDCVTLTAWLRPLSWRLAARATPTRHRIVWINRGTGRAELDGSTRGCSPNTLIYVPEAAVLSLELAPNATGWALSVDAAASLPLPMPDHAFHLHLGGHDKQSSLAALCDDISREAGQSDEATRAALTCQAGLLAVWLSRNGPERDSQPSETPSARIVRRFLRRVEQEFRRDHAVSDYSAALGVTPTHLSRVCREITGKSALEIIHDRMIEEAKLRLSSSGTRVSDVASDLGFSSSAYFTRLFTQKSGQAPTAFRAAATLPPNASAPSRRAESAF